MPELPEVETIKRQLAAHLPEWVLEKVEILDAKLAASLPKENWQKLLGLKVKSLNRRAKVLLVEFEKDYRLAFHLKMTGKVILKKAGQFLTELPQVHTRAIFTFTNGAKLYFSDLRQFGWIKFLEGKLYEQALFKHPLGPEPFNENFSVDYLQSALSKSRRPIKVFLLDQEMIAGIGNIYASEALFLAKINPAKKANTLSKEEIELLFTAILSVLKKGIELGGASDNDYLNAYGQKGEYQNHFLVYGQNGKACKNCQGKIIRIAQGGRGTFFCPHCQTE